MQRVQKNICDKKKIDKYHKVKLNNFGLLYIIAAAYKISNHSACTLDVKVRNMKMDFNTGGTWRRVGQ